MIKNRQLIRTTKVRLFPTASKLERLKKTMEDFHQALQTAIDCYWKMDKIRGSFPPKELRLPGRIGSDASVLAWQIVKGTEKTKGSKPEIENPVLVLNEASGRITGKITKAFDLWFSIIDSRNKRSRLLIPSKKTRHLNKLLSEGFKLRKDIKIKLKGKKVFAYLTLVREKLEEKNEGEILAVDIGYRKLLALSNGTMLGIEIKELIERYCARYVRCPRTIKHYINRTLKELPWERVKTVVIERLRNLRNGKKGVWSRETNRRFNSWLYGWTIRRLREFCQENGVLLVEVNPRDTSRRCPACQEVEPGNRNGERFSCLHCGYEQDADYVGAVNILHRFLFPAAGSVAAPKAENI